MDQDQELLLKERERRYHDHYYREHDSVDYLIDKEHFQHKYLTPEYVGGIDRGAMRQLAFQLLNMEQITGKRVLDYACGDGKYGVFLALCGANVVRFFFWISFLTNQYV